MRRVWFCAAIVVVLEVVIYLIVAPLRPSAFALQATGSARIFGEIVHMWSPAELERYRLHLLIDYGLLLAYGCLGWMLVWRTKLFRHLSRLRQYLVAFMLPLAAVFDVAENSLHWWLTEMPRFGVRHLYQISFACTLMKWLLVFAFAALFLWMLARGDSRRGPKASD